MTGEHPPKQARKNVKLRADAYRALHAAKGTNETWHDAAKRMAAQDPLPDACRECGSEDVGAFVVDPLPGTDDPGPVREARMTCDDCGREWTWTRGDGEEARDA
jgi:hypothetical protein